MKIAIIADALDYQYAGIFYYTRELINAIAQLDTDNEYWIVRSQSGGDWSENVKELVIPAPPFPGAAVYRLLVAIPRKLAKMGMDIVVEPRHFGPFFLPKTIKRITVIHDLTPIHSPHWHQLPSSLLQRLFLPGILSRADHIITNSNYTASDISNYFPDTQHKITPVHLGKSAQFKPDYRSEVLEKYGITRPYLLHVGTIEPRKNLSFLLDCFEQLKEGGYPSLQLVLVGKKGWKSENFIKKLNQSKWKTDIVCSGYVTLQDLPAIYSQCAAFVYPSHFEGFGLPVLEAMACGAPVITSNNSCLPEVVGSGGWLYEPGNYKDLLQKIKQLLSNPALQKELQLAAIAQAKQFCWEKTAQETIAVFKKI